MATTLTENRIENNLSTKDLVKLDNSIQDIKQAVSDAIENVNIKIGARTKEINNSLNELKSNTTKYHLPKLYKKVVSLANGYYLDDLFNLENDFYVKVGKRADHPKYWNVNY